MFGSRLSMDDHTRRILGSLVEAVDEYLAGRRHLDDVQAAVASGGGALDGSAGDIPSWLGGVAEDLERLAFTTPVELQRDYVGRLADALARRLSEESERRAPLS